MLIQFLLNIMSVFLGMLLAAYIWDLVEDYNVKKEKAKFEKENAKP